MVVTIGGVDHLYDDIDIKAIQERTNKEEFKTKNRVSKVTFNEEAHSYTSDLSGKKYISTTQIISKFKQPFDKVAVSTAYAKKNGNTPEYWQKQWSEISKIACDKGTKFHKMKEDAMLSNGSVIQDKRVIPVHISEVLKQANYNYKDIPDGVYPELLLWNHYFELAGISDIVTIEGNYFIIDDFKTNRKIDRTSFRHPRTGYKKMTFPLQHIQDCVAGNTKLITKEGISTIKECLEKDIEIWNGEQWSLVKPFQTGNAKELYRVTFSDGSYLDCTDNHKFLIKHRLDKGFSEMTLNETKKMFDNTSWLLRLPRTSVSYEDGIQENSAYEYGFILGDGSVTRNAVTLDLYGSKQDITFNKVKKSKTYIRYEKEYKVIEFDLPLEFCKDLKYAEGLPDSIFTWSRKSILDFVAGWADSDGSVTNNSNGLRIYSTEDKIRSLQLLLTKCGITSTCNLMQKAGTVTNLSVRKKDIYYINILTTKDIFTKRLKSKSKESANKKGKYQIIKSIEKLEGLHATYCLTDKHLNQCLFNNVLTKQCNFQHYQLQLSTYAFMLEQLSGKICKSICFHHHPPQVDNPLEAVEEGIRYDCKYLRDDVLKMLHTATGKDISQFIKK